MSRSHLFESFHLEPKPRPFPTRGVPGGWHDPWDADSLDSALSALRQQRFTRRQVIEVRVQLELVAQARADGRWEAHVTSSDGAAVPWPSVNGPSASVALDALEAEVRELLGGARGDPGAAAEAEAQG